MKDIDLNTSGNLPKSSASKAGATQSAMGDCDMDCLDMGFHKLTEQQADARISTLMTEDVGGFLTRPHGWER